LEEDDNHVALAFDNTMIVLWRGVQEPRVCDGLYDLAIRLARIQGTRQVAAVVIAEPGSKPPSKLARLALQRLHEDSAGVVYRVALVPSEGGFVEASIRSVIITLRRRLTRHDNQDVFSRVEEAVFWATSGLVTALRTPVDCGLLLRELAEFRSEKCTSNRTNAVA
jgi:hypothetical protein